MKVQEFRDLIGQFVHQFQSLKSAATPDERIAEARHLLRVRAELKWGILTVKRAKPADVDRAFDWLATVDKHMDESPGLRAELALLAVSAVVS